MRKSQSAGDSAADCRLLPAAFVAVTCHYDILDWLEPDWVLDMVTGRVERRLLWRPNIELEIYKTSRDSWKLFAPHHYLNTSEMKNGAPYIALWDGVPVACCVVGTVNKFNFHRISRIVTLPDYQGVGIGGRFLDTLCELYRSQGKRITIVGSHPSILSHCKRSPLWMGRAIDHAGTVIRDKNKPAMTVRKRTTASFEYVGDGNPKFGGKRGQHDK